MLQCPTLDADRTEAKLYTRTMMGGSPTWEEWLANDEVDKTRLFIGKVAKKWGEKARMPHLSTLDYEDPN